MAALAALFGILAMAAGGVWIGLYEHEVLSFWRMVIAWGGSIGLLTIMSLAVDGEGLEGSAGAFAVWVGGVMVPLIAWGIIDIAQRVWEAAG